MSRISILMRQPKSVLGVLTALVVAVASGANFTAESANPSNTFATGNLSMDNSKANAAVFTPTNMKPGGTPDTGTVDIKNSGSISGSFSVKADTITNSDATNPLAPKIDVIVKDCGNFASGTPTCDSGDPVVYTGTLAAFTSSNALGTFTAGEQHRYEFSAQLNSSAGDEYESDNASARFVWNAVQ
jgi:spore coat-associated protein N